jgi:cytochrome P450
MVVRPLLAFSVSRAATDDFQWREFTIVKGTALMGLWPNVHEPFEQPLEFSPDLYADDPMLDVSGTQNVANTSFGGGESGGGAWKPTAW